MAAPSRAGQQGLDRDTLVVAAVVVVGVIMSIFDTTIVNVALEPGNVDHVKDAINIFGGCYIGVALPVSAQRQETWTVPQGGPTGQGAPGSWGGHAVICVAYNPRRVTCITWGRAKQMTWRFFTTYCEEAYAVVSKDWLCRDGKAPVGLDLDGLMAAVQQLSDKPVPAGVPGR